MRKAGFWKTDWFLGLLVTVVMLVAAWLLWREERPGPLWRRAREQD